MTASDGRFEVKINERTHLVIESGTGRCLGAAGANFYRPWAFPLYTPSGLTVVREFPYEHPFHTGVFVGQHPVRVGGRVGNFWVAPPVRSFDDPLAADLGRVDSAVGPEVAIDQDAVRFTFRCVWRDAREQPMLDEVRTMTFRALPEATICDVASRLSIESLMRRRLSSPPMRCNRSHSRSSLQRNAWMRQK